MEELRTITVCDNPFLSKVVQNALEENGIACVAIDQTIAGSAGGYGPMPGYEIRVSARNEERATEIVNEILEKRAEGGE